MWFRIILYKNSNETGLYHSQLKTLATSASLKRWKREKALWELWRWTYTHGINVFNSILRTGNKFTYHQSKIWLSLYIRCSWAPHRSTSSLNVRRKASNGGMTWHTKTYCIMSMTLPTYIYGILYLYILLSAMSLSGLLFIR